MQYKILNDFLIKIPNNHPYNKPHLNKVQLIFSSNNLPHNNKLLTPLLNTSISITGQHPTLIKAKKSVASFKLRKGAPVGILTTLLPSKGFGLYSNKLTNFFKLWQTYYLPKFYSNKNILNLGFPSKDYSKSTLTMGIQYMGVLSYLTPLANENLGTIRKNQNLINTGGYWQSTLKFKLPEKYSSKFNNLFIHKYYYSIKQFPIKF
jgi:hypothetical protein